MREADERLINGEADDADGDNLKQGIDEQAAECSGNLVAILIHDHGESVGIIAVEETRRLAEEIGKEVGFDSVGDFSIEF